MREEADAKIVGLEGFCGLSGLLEISCVVEKDFGGDHLEGEDTLEHPAKALWSAKRFFEIQEERPEPRRFVDADRIIADRANRFADRRRHRQW